VIEEIVGDEPAAIERAVTVVIPAYNEGDHVAAQVRAVRETMERSDWPFEIIVVDDGSVDRTAIEADSTGARVLRRVKNRGYGAALKLGIQHARYGWTLITDADGTYPVESIPRSSRPPSAIRWWSALASGNPCTSRSCAGRPSGFSGAWPATLRDSAFRTSIPASG
jgi:glycosyltransferase involved in cell wall biosynthesis